MSNQYPGGIITKNPATPTGPYESGAAPGIWTLTQQAGYKQQGVWPTAGLSPNYIEDVFSTYLYTGNGSTQTITNGIDLSTKGGLTWIRRRGSATDHHLEDTVRGATKYLISNTTNAEQTNANAITAFNSTGFSLGSMSDVNSNNGSFVSWTFREQAKFFDVVTYTGASGNAVQNITHNLGSVPGTIIVKCIDAGPYDWIVYHRSLGATQYINLNSTAAAATTINYWNNTAPTSTQFTAGISGGVNGDGQNYIAYLFAHDAGGFGLAGTDNVISCGSFSTGAGGGATVTLGYEPQWLMIKSSSNTSAWYTFDTMRGWNIGAASRGLSPNTSNAEFNFGSSALPTNPTATGFTFTDGLFAASETWIYIAIRRGPMKVPTLGTSVFSPNAASSGTQTTNFPVDMQILSYRTGTDAFLNHQVIDRLRGVSSTSTPQGNYLNTTSTAAESNATPYSSTLMSNVGFDVPSNYAGASSVFHSFKRAPSFFDVVCYTGTSTARTQAHNLGVAPELMIFRRKDITDDWWVTSNFGASTCKYMYLNQTGGQSNLTYSPTNQYTAAPTATGLLFGSDSITNGPYSYVCYLFATCAGVSKVGSYTGTGTTLQINCGFTAGARFVLIKRTDSTGDWYVWDSARGIIAGNDPYLLLNSTAAEVTGTDYVDTYSAGFEISSTAPAAINASAGTFVFLAIA